MSQTNLILADLKKAEDDLNQFPADERWCPIQGYEGYYDVSDRGVVRSCTRTIPHARYGTVNRLARLRKPSTRTDGYLIVGLHRGGRTTASPVHRLVAAAFCSGRDAEHSQVNHKDGNKLNNAAGNLEWVTAQQNTVHAHANGLIKYRRGEDNRASRITAADVLAIRAARERGIPAKEVAAKYGIATTYVWEITSGRSWGHV